MTVGSIYTRLEKEIVHWATERPDAMALVVIGSRARTTFTPDEFADLDLLLFTSRAEEYALDSEWLREILELWIAVPNRTGSGDAEWLILCAGGLKVDIVLIPIQPSTPLSTALSVSPYQSVLKRGFKVLLDKTPSDYQIQWQPPTEVKPTLPTAVEFGALVDQSLLTAARAVKFTKRGDTWRAKVQTDGELKKCLLGLIEWQAVVVNSHAQKARLDTWYDGRNLTRWASPHVVERLPSTFAAYDPADLKRALVASIELFDWLAADVGRLLGYDYPSANQRKVLEWLLDQLRLPE